MRHRVAALRALADEAAGCRACDLWERATQTVFGDGRPGAPLFAIGEQPGDQEDLAGAPFVGPAGRVLDDALEEAGIDRADLYVTNAVKHFKWTPRGKRRIHERPNLTEVVACRPWLHRELELVEPRCLVVLGATAGQALFGSAFRVGAARGQTLDIGGRPVVATLHPSAVLRAPDPTARAKGFADLVGDLARAAGIAGAVAG